MSRTRWRASALARRACAARARLGDRGGAYIRKARAAPARFAHGAACAAPPAAQLPADRFFPLPPYPVSRLAIPLPRVAPQQVAAQRALIEHLLQTLEPDCAAELRTVLETPQEQQTQDQLSETCREAVQQTAAAFRQAQGGAAAGAEGQEGGEGGAAQRAAPRRYERVKLPPKGSGGAKKSGSSSRKSAAASGPSFLTRLSKVDWSEYAEVGKLLFVLLVAVVGFVVYAYVSFQEKEDKLTPEEKAARAEAEAAQTAATKKNIAKAERQGRAKEQ